MMEAARTSETSVDIQLRTRQYIPEDSELHTRRRENLKSHKSFEYFIKNNNTKWRNQFFFLQRFPQCSFNYSLRVRMDSL
jgi:hypothetical protein